MDLPRVENPSNGVIDEFGLGERLVTALVRTDPQPCREQTCHVSVRTPQHKLGQRIQPWVREADILRGNKGVNESSCLPYSANNNKVPDPGSPRQ